MIEVRIHGRGGQGAVIASKILAVAVFKEGNYVQSFPNFGVERRGAPVTAYTRIDNKPIFLRCKIYNPDHLVVLDPSLIEAINITEGLKDKGWVIINSDKEPSHFNSLLKKHRVATVDASGIALRHGLGTKANPIVNTAILGAFCKVTGLFSLPFLLEAVQEEVPAAKERNVRAVEEAYHQVSYLEMP